MMAPSLLNKVLFSEGGHWGRAVGGKEGIKDANLWPKNVVFVCEAPFGQVQLTDRERNEHHISALEDTRAATAVDDSKR